MVTVSSAVATTLVAALAASILAALAPVIPEAKALPAPVIQSLSGAAVRSTVVESELCTQTSIAVFAGPAAAITSENFARSV
ncbi:hypothetical protein D3C72_2162970 [compost metagenome]